MTIRTAIIGFGTGGRFFHAPLLAAEPRFTVSAIVTGDPARAAAASGYAGPTSCRTPRRSSPGTTSISS